ncbi:hypothetical protein Tco_1403628 [Tanacetum coccineum]
MHLVCNELNSEQLPLMIQSHTEIRMNIAITIISSLNELLPLAPGVYVLLDSKDVMTADKNYIIWLMASIGSSPCLNTGTVRPKSNWGNSDGCLLSVGLTVIHTVETDIVTLVVEIESFGMSFDEFDYGTRLPDWLATKGKLI